MEKAKIELNMILDENKVPEQLFWSASDGGVFNEEAKAIILSIWDEKSNDTLRIDLWTKTMQIDHMKRFIHQTITSLASTYDRATGDSELSQELFDFCEYFKEKANL